jgi:hypothetical protein
MICLVDSFVVVNLNFHCRGSKLRFSTGGVSPKISTVGGWRTISTVGGQTLSIPCCTCNAALRHDVPDSFHSWSRHDSPVSHDSHVESSNIFCYSGFRPRSRGDFCETLARSRQGFPLFNRINLGDSAQLVKRLCKNPSLSYIVQIFSFFLFCPIANRIRLCHKQYNGNAKQGE